jgi:hypothetical protein
MATTVIKTRIQLRRGTTAEWEANKNTVPYEGEPCYDLDLKILKIGDGVTTYENLDGFHAGEISSASTHYEGIRADGETDNDVIARVLSEAETEANKDDIFIVKTLIADERYSHTAYVYNGSAWAAMDGNYNAKNVYFDEDLVLTQTFGKYAVSSSVPNVTVNATGMSMYDLIMDAYSEKKNPSKTAPKVSAFNVTGNGDSLTSFEVGTTVTPQWVSTFNAGSYTYKSSASTTTISPVSGTGVTATAWKVKQGDAVIGTSKDGTADASFVIGDENTSEVSGTVSYSVTADYSNGNYALTNLNTLPDSEVRITAGTTEANTDTLTFVRKMFGAGTTEDVVDSAVIRSMVGTTASVVGSSAPFEFKAVAGDTKVVFAYPKALTTKTPKFEIFTMAWGETSGFVSSEIEVADARGTNEDGSLNNAMTYTVWTYTPAGAFAAAETKYRAYF